MAMPKMIILAFFICLGLVQGLSGEEGRDLGGNGAFFGLDGKYCFGVFLVKMDGN